MCVNWFLSLKVFILLFVENRQRFTLYLSIDELLFVSSDGCGLFADWPRICVGQFRQDVANISCGQGT